VIVAKTRRFAISTFTSTVLFLFLASFVPAIQARAADFVVDGYVADSNTPSVQIDVTDLWATSAVTDQLIASVSNPTLDTALIEISCVVSDASVTQTVITCNFASPTLSQEIAAKQGDYWVDELDYEMTVLHGSDSYIWPLRLHNKNAYEITSLSPVMDFSSYVGNLQKAPNSVAVAAKNSFGLLIACEIEVLLDGKLLSTLDTDGQTSLPISMAGLQIGNHRVDIRATNDFGTFSDAVNFGIVTAKVNGLSLNVSSIFYPIRDGYADTLSIAPQFITNTQVPLPGKGSLSVLDATGKKLQSWNISDTKSAKYEFKGLKNGKPYLGKVKLILEFTPVGAKKIVSSKTVVASPKKLVKSTGSKTYKALSVMTACDIGFSYNPCHSMGGDLELYSSGNQDVMFVGGSLPLPANATRWKLTFGKLFMGGSALFTVEASDQDYDPGNWSFLGNLPKATGPYSTWTSSWSKQIDNSAANFTIGSRDYGIFTMGIITITYEYSKLQ